MTDPITAADVQVENLDEDELRAQKSKRAREARQTRSAALRGTGAISPNVGTNNLLTARLEARLKAIDADIANKHKASDVVKARLR
jgi:hypothetical protein